MSQKSERIPNSTETTYIPVSPSGNLLTWLRTKLEGRKEVKRFSKFAIVGGIGFVIDFGVSNLLWTILPLTVTLSLPFGLAVTQTGIGSAVGFTVAVCSNFIWNRYWTYPDSRSKAITYQLVTFFGINTIGLLIRTPVLEITSVPLTAWAGELLSVGETLAMRIGNNIALMIAVVVVMFWNFFVNRYWTYSDVE